MDYRSGAVSPVGSINAGWAMIKDDYWVFFGMVIIAGLITLVVGGIFGALNNVVTFAVSAMVGTARTSSEGAGLAMSLIPQIISIIISFFSNIIVVTVSGVLICGVYAAIAKKAATGIADFGLLFAKFDVWLPCLIVSVVLAVIQLIISVIGLGVGLGLGVGAIGLSGIGDRGFDFTLLGGMLLVIVGIVLLIVIANLIISMLTTFVYPLVGDRGLSGVDALMLSARAALSNFGGVFVLWLLLSLMAIAGVAVCLIGVLFVGPVIAASIFAAYQSVFGSAQTTYQQSPPPPPVWGAPPGHQPGY